MYQPNNETSGGAVNQEAFDRAIRDNLSPEMIAALIVFLEPATEYKTSNEKADTALGGVNWFANTLTDLLGGEAELERLRKELWM